MPDQERNQLDANSARLPGRRRVRRPFIGILFECCGTYARVYRQPGEPFYLGRCPSCLRTVRVRVGRDGTNSRLFRAH